MSDFSDYIVYVDESGDHGLANIDPLYPVFALSFCVVRKQEYVENIVPALQKFKFDIWGHDSIVLHEHDIRKNKGPFAFLRADQTRRERFYDTLNILIEKAPFTIFASVIDKKELRAKYGEKSWSPYEASLFFCMNRLCDLLSKENQKGKTIHIVFESRGKREDKELKLEFCRIADSQRQWGGKGHDFGLFDFQPVFMSKKSNSSGLQLADLTARPIALSFLRPEQQNRAFEMIKPKLGDLKYFP